jgi:hypothetical protein
MTEPKPFKTPAERREFLFYYARVLIREAKARRGSNVTWMIEGAAKARREAFAIDVTPAQKDLFG